MKTLKQLAEYIIDNNISEYKQQYLLVDFINKKYCDLSKDDRHLKFMSAYSNFEFLKQKIKRSR